MNVQMPLIAAILGTILLVSTGSSHSETPAALSPEPGATVGQQSATLLKAPSNCIECYTIVKLANTASRKTTNKPRTADTTDGNAPKPLTRNPYRPSSTGPYQREDPLAWRTKKIVEVTLRDDNQQLLKVRAAAGHFKEGDRVYVLALPAAQ